MSMRAGRSIIICVGTRTWSRVALARKSSIRARCLPPPLRNRVRDWRDGTGIEEKRAMTTLRALIAAALVVGMFGWAVAKLPAPPPMDEKAKAAAEEKKAKDAAAAEAAKAAQARAEDRVAARYIAEQKAKGTTVTPQLGPAVIAASAPAAKGAAPAASAPAPAKK